MHKNNFNFSGGPGALPLGVLKELSQSVWALKETGYSILGLSHRSELFLSFLKTRGRLLVLEFSKITPALAPFYDFYSFKIIPKIGKLVANDFESYQYLSESIRMHPDQESLKTMMESAGFSSVSYHNMTFGVVALHIGIK